MSMKHYLAARKRGTQAAARRTGARAGPVSAGAVRACAHPQQADAGAARAGADRAGSNRGHGDEGAHDGVFARLHAAARSRIPSSPPRSVLYDGIVEDGLRQPIVALEYYNRFYIVEGNKRVERYASASMR